MTAILGRHASIDQPIQSIHGRLEELGADLRRRSKRQERHWHATRALPSLTTAKPKRTTPRRQTDATTESAEQLLTKGEALTTEALAEQEGANPDRILALLASSIRPSGHAAPGACRAAAGTPSPIGTGPASAGAELASWSRRTRA